MFEQTFKNIDDILHKDAGCTSELDYTEQSSWLLFLKYLDALESDKALEAELDGKTYQFFIDKPYRWESWATPDSTRKQAGIADSVRSLESECQALESIYQRKIAALDDLKNLCCTRPLRVFSTVAP